MDILKRLQNWYKIHCDGDWEHSYGVVIDTLDNPGWKVIIDLTDTLLEDVEFRAVCLGSPEEMDTFWIDCHKVGNTFVGMGSADSLEKLLVVFLDWADCNTNTSEWDSTVNIMIDQCNACTTVEQLRQLYKEIDSVPSEHKRKKELLKTFDEKWNRLIEVTLKDQ